MRNKECRCTPHEDESFRPGPQFRIVPGLGGASPMVQHQTPTVPDQFSGAFQLLEKIPYPGIGTKNITPWQVNP